MHLRFHPADFSTIRMALAPAAAAAVRLLAENKRRVLRRVAHLWDDPCVPQKGEDSRPTMVKGLRARKL